MESSSSYLSGSWPSSSCASTGWFIFMSCSYRYASTPPWAPRGIGIKELLPLRPLVKLEKDRFRPGRSRIELLRTWNRLHTLQPSVLPSPRHDKTTPAALRSSSLHRSPTPVHFSLSSSLVEHERLEQKELTLLLSSHSSQPTDHCPILLRRLHLSER
ncbi:hypothetical protein PENTCL1PPCAC_21132, partial [Pristionchus entomophagus]